MDIINLWGNVSDNIGFYTKETAQKIPNRPGIYAWYIPLWLYFDDMREFVDFLHKINLYDESVKESKFKFNWDYVTVSAKKGFCDPNYSTWAPKWNQMILDPESQDVFARALMKASIFTTPVYIGRADDLAVRYQQHVDGKGDSGVFSNRFQKYLSRTNKKLLVSDLLFACVSLSQKENKLINDRELTALLENIMMHIVQPPFSKK